MTGTRRRVPDFQMIKLEVDHTCLSVDGIHARIRLLREVTKNVNKQRYIELIDHKSKEKRYYPIHYHDIENISVDFETYLLEHEITILYKHGKDYYQISNMKKVSI